MALRGELIMMMVDLCVAEDMDRTDLEECLLDFIDLKFNIMIEDNSAKEIANALMKIRGELIQAVNERGVLESAELEKLREFNESKNEARKRREEREREIEREEVDSSSDDENAEEEKEPPKLQPKGPVIDDDGFEMVTKKGGRRK